MYRRILLRSLDILLVLVVRPRSFLGALPLLLMASSSDELLSRSTDFLVDICSDSLTQLRLLLGGQAAHALLHLFSHNVLHQHVLN